MTMQKILIASNFKLPVKNEMSVSAISKKNICLIQLVINTLTHTHVTVAIKIMYLSNLKNRWTN